MSYELPTDEYERRLSRQGAEAKDWIARLLVCWSIFLTILAGNLAAMVMDGRPWHNRTCIEIGGSPNAILLALFAGAAAVSALRNRSSLPRRWFVIGLVPWFLLVLKATALLALLLLSP